MGRSYRRGSEDRRFQDDYEVYSKNEQATRAHRQEKKTIRALKTFDLDALSDDQDWEEDYE